MGGVLDGVVFQRDFLQRGTPMMIHILLKTKIPINDALSLLVVTHWLAECRGTGPTTRKIQLEEERRCSKVNVIWMNGYGKMKLR